MRKWLNSLEKIDKISFTILGIMLLMTLIGCEGEEDICIKGEYTKGVVCTEQYDPVCAPDGTTYMNSCYAEKDGWDNSCIVLGECNE